jgi:formylglycine-generating enzyme required for sulfatase activity
VAYVDLQSVGKEENPDRWFGAVADKIGRELKLETDSYGWWLENEKVTPAYRFSRFVEDVLLPAVPETVVLLFDEIDTILKLSFSDDFFTTIRSMINARAHQPEYRRLVFGVAGVARPADFVKERSRTPFNVGTSVRLEDFSPENVGPFREKLGAHSGALVDRIFYWTAGQPLLTQRLAKAAFEWEETKRTPEALDDFVKRRVINPGMDSDPHFAYIRDFLLERSGPVGKVMRTYRKVLAGKPVAYDDRNPVHEGLRLAGVARVAGEVLAPRNEIYRRVFNDEWAKENTPRNLLKFSLAGVSVALVGTLLWFLWVKPMYFPDFVPLQSRDWFEREIIYTDRPAVFFNAVLPSTPIRKIKLGKRKLEIPEMASTTSSAKEGEFRPNQEARRKVVGLDQLKPGVNEFSIRFYGVFGEPSYRTRIVVASFPRNEWKMPEWETAFLSPGEFLMGSPEDEPGRDSDERQHRVTLTQGFHLQTTEVTQDQWQAVMGYNPSYFQECGGDCPVENVSWEHVQEFIRRLNVLAGGEVFRLPTEAEWEYAARAGTTTAIYNGPMEILGQRNAPVLDPIAWYGGNSGVEYPGGWDSSEWPEKQYDHKRAGAHPVGLKTPNDWGLYDMIGNVWEWCGDWYGEYPEGPVIDPKGPPSGTARVLRGGGWGAFARYCRAAFRFNVAPDIRDNGIGFRVVGRRAQ